MRVKSEKIILILGVTGLVLLIALTITVNLNVDVVYLQSLTLLISCMLFLVLLALSIFYYKNIFKPLKLVNKAATALVKGDVNAKIEVKSEGVIADVANHMNNVFQNVRSATEFAQAIGEGEFNSEVAEHSENDALTKALFDMREKLKQVSEEEKKRNWAVQGLATFSELLRNNQDDIEELGFNVIKNLVKYLGANQGGFFVYKPFEGNAINEEDRLFKGKVELAACYAYEKRKYKQKEMQVGEGLVGQCVVEHATIYLNDVPDNYINITSGLGKATPRSILIVPLKVNDEIYGVLEIASFKNIESHEVKFVEDLSESIASTLSSVKMSMETKQLLDLAEESNQEMKRKEEQMEDIQQELAEKLKQNEEDAAQFQSIVEAINKTNASIEFDLSGNIIEVNSMFLSVMGYARADLIGQPEEVLLTDVEKKSPQHAMMWQSIKNGQYFSGEFKRLSKSGKEIWMTGTYNPIYDAQNQPYKIVKFATFTTDEKERELDLSGKLNALRESVGVMEIDLNKKVRAINPMLLKDLGYKRLETRNKGLDFYTGADYMKSTGFKHIWAQLNDGDSARQTLTIFDKQGNEKHYMGNFSTVKNMLNQVTKILCVLVDVSQEVKREKDLQQQLEEVRSNSMIKLSVEAKDAIGTLSSLDEILEELNKDELSAESLVEKNKMPILIIDQNDLKITDCTELMYTLLGYEKDEVKGKEFIEITDVSQRAALDKSLRDNKVFQEDIKLIGKDQTAHEISFMFAPILGGKDEHDMVCAIAYSK